MPPLRRHQLLCLNAHGWETLAALDDTPLPEAALRLWRLHGWPLVVCRQDSAAPQAWLSVGLPLPGRWGRRRCALQVPREGVAWLAEFPTLQQMLPALPPGERGRLARLAFALTQAGLRAHVYGSHGWQQLTGLGYVRAGSDLDVWVGVAHADEADLVARCLAQAGEAGLRLDGELVFPQGDAVSWREWQRFRAGGSASLLVKDLHGARLSRTVPGEIYEIDEVCCA